MIWAIAWNDLTWGIVIALVLAMLWVPQFITEIRDGKRDFAPIRRLVGGGKVVVGPEAPLGSGDVNPGRRGDPAPG